MGTHLPKMRHSSITASYNLCGSKRKKLDFMSNTLVHAFFVGRAVAEILNEQLENALTDALSELGKFDAEQRERWRQFTQEVMERANREAETVSVARSTTVTVPKGSETVDVQIMIDELRAEIALLRAELQRYRSSSV